MPARPGTWSISGEDTRRRGNQRAEFRHTLWDFGASERETLLGAKLPRLVPFVKAQSDWKATAADADAILKPTPSSNPCHPQLSGTTERPRLAVFRSNKHLYAQVIDDTQSVTIAAASTVQAALREELKLTAGPTMEAAKRVGEELAKLCLSKGISKVAFDRGGFIYHGRIQALADAAREAGLEF
eukprot:SM000137S00475  [mRNA]  locus=s137:291555:292261:+ [translate_table: standard]